MRILILGSGGREYALCKALLGNTLFCIGKSLNPGLIDLSTSHYSSKNLTLSFCLLCCSTDIFAWLIACSANEIEFL